MRSIWTTAVLLIVVALPAAAEIYRWTDEQGRVHFTQDLSQVPPEHRSQALERTLEAAPTTRVNTYSSPRADAPAAARAPSSGDRLGGKRVYRIRVERAGTALVVGARVNNSLVVPFLVDTGASDVSIPQWAADRLGLDSTGRTREYQTANGVVEEDVIMLRSVDLGGARVEHVPASISRSMEMGLLGLSFLNHFTYNLDAAAGVLTLVPNDLEESGRIRGGRSEAQWRAEYAGLRYRLERIDAERRRTNPNQSSKLRHLEKEKREVLAQLELLEGEADQARVPMVWRE
jgi:clan AA aspartic protease (TIGR02281 family)